MTLQSNSTIKLLLAVVGCGMGAGCDHQPRIGVIHDGLRTVHAVSDSAIVGDATSAPSIARDSVDARCFGPSRQDNTEVVACPAMMRLAIAAE